MIAHGRGTVTGNGPVIGLVLTLIAGCAGSDTPPRDAELEANLISAYEAGQGGAAGSANAGTAGAAGSANAAVGGAAGAGDPGPSGPGSGGAAGANAVGVGGTPCDAPGTIFTTTCSGSTCHVNGAPIGDFGDGAAAAEALVNQPSSQGADCGLLINSSDPEESLILTKTNGTFNRTTCGALEMPLGSGDLTPDELACVESWLNQFAD
jgi:hypothetical protein